MRAPRHQALARILQGDVDGNDAVALSQLEREPRLLEVAAISESLAVALDRFAEFEGRDAFLAALGRAPASLASAHPLLLAHAIEAAADARVDAGVLPSLSAVARERAYRRDEHDALRRVAAAAARNDPVAGAELGARYAALCVDTFAPAMPLGWPIRSAGQRLRVVVLLAPAAITAATRGALAGLAALPRDVFDVAVATLGRASDDVMNVARTVAPAVVELPPSADAVVGKALVARDFDVLVDLAGTAAVPLLAQRPARVIYSLSTIAGPSLPSLSDRTFSDDGALIGALFALHAAHDVGRDCALDAAALDACGRRGTRTSAVTRSRAAAYTRLLDVQPGFAPDTICAESWLAKAAIAAARVGSPRRSRRPPSTRASPPPALRQLRTSRVVFAVRGRAGALAGERRAVASLGLAQLALRSGARAAAAFERALALDPADGDTHYNHGVALQIQRSFIGAARAYQRALAFKPSLVDADYNLGVLFQQQDAVDAAIKAYETVLDADPTHVSAYKNLGEVLLGAGKFDAWIANFERFEANCPDALPLAVQALEVCQYLGDFQKVDRYLTGCARKRSVSRTSCSSRTAWKCSSTCCSISMSSRK
jgi:tetratricopeptide (TPR) repeat protein